MISLYMNSRHIRPLDIRLLVHESDSLQVRCDSRDEFSSAHSQCEKISLSRSAALSHALDESRRSKFQRFSNLQVNFVIISLFHPHSALSFFFVPSPWRYIKQILVRFPSACELNRNLVAPLRELHYLS